MRQAFPVCVGRADVVLGQPDLNKPDHKELNGNPAPIVAPSQNALRVPTGVATDGQRLVVADTDNNRVLIWNSIPTSNNQPADVVVGQSGFTSNAGTVAAILTKDDVIVSDRLNHASIIDSVRLAKAMTKCTTAVYKHSDMDDLRAKLAEWGGNASGVNVANIDNLGNVHPDTMWWDCTLGNVRSRAFGDIWRDTRHPIMAGLKARPRRVGGRCGGCAYFDVCGGNTRVRALKVSGDPWAEDPGCYLDDEEIAA